MKTNWISAALAAISAAILPACDIVILPEIKSGITTTQHFNLAPLKIAEVASYIEFRLRAAGYHGPNPFTGRAVEMIARISEGLSRRINIIADKALLAAYSSGSHQVDTAEVKIAAQDARFAPIQYKASGQHVPALKIAIALLMTLALAALAVALWARQPPASPAAALPAPESAQLPAQGSAATPPVTNPARPAAEGGTLIAQHTALYADWLATAASDHYFIQLTARSGNHTEDIENFLVRAGQWLEPTELRVYRTGSPESGQIGVIYGDYQTRAAALAAVRGFPDEVRRMRPYPRAVSGLQ